MHYEATPENCATGAGGKLLVQIRRTVSWRTTDVTRTIVVGPVSDEMKKHYTMVAAAVMQLPTLTGSPRLCPEGNPGYSVARQPIWGYGY